MLSRVTRFLRTRFHYAFNGNRASARYTVARSRVCQPRLRARPRSLRAYVFPPNVLRNARFLHPFPLAPILSLFLLITSVRFDARVTLSSSYRTRCDSVSLAPPLYDDCSLFFSSMFLEERPNVSGHFEEVCEIVSKIWGNRKC